MPQGFNLLRTAAALQDPLVHRFELEVQGETAGRNWRATLTTRGGRQQLVFDSPEALMRSLTQLTLQQLTPDPHGRGASRGLF